MEGPEKGKSFEFSEADTFLVGRSRYAHLRFDADADRRISRTHFLLDVRPPQCIITDLDSRNGTYVNGRRINQIELKDGDKVKVGRSVIHVYIKADEELPVSIFCIECGKEIAAEEPGDLPNICRACKEKQKLVDREEVFHTVLPTAPSKLSYTCVHCSKDLSDGANADGKAAAFESAQYICKDCFIKKEELNLAFKTLGDYSILCMLGTGILGSVYQVVHRPTRRLYAIKKIHSESVRDERAAMRFEREMNVQSMLAHPNLLKTADSGRAGIIPYFVTEFMAGGDIENLITHTFKGPVEPALACAITVQILNGLKALHDRGYIHRDLKPANFLLDRPHDEKNCQVKITGYGLAKSYESAGNSLFDYTKTGQFGGSYMFMPPEQIFDYKHVKPPADIYAVGTTLYYMLCAKYTVDFPTPLDMLMRAIAKKTPRNPVEIILEDPPVPLLQRKPDIDGRLAVIVDKAVSKDAGKRIQSVDEFRERLLEAMKTGRE